jgi:hypothetical protein
MNRQLDFKIRQLSQVKVKLRLQRKIVRAGDENSYRQADRQTDRRTNRHMVYRQTR